MNTFSRLKLNVWWKVMLLLGIVLLIVVLTNDITLVDAASLFGMASGMVIAGLANFSAEKYGINHYRGGSMEGYYVEHGFISGTVFLIGLLMILGFGFKMFYLLLT